MNQTYSKKFKARWGDMDFNGHMANTAYLDVAADVRMMFFEENGFTMREFEHLRIGPVIMKDEIDYHRELRLLEQMEVHHELSGLSEDGSRFRMRNVFYREDGKKAATVTSSIIWLSLDERRPVPPPGKLHQVLKEIPCTADFEVLPGASR